MKIALAALGFITKDIVYNQRKIINSIKEYSQQVDLILFGESFLQGFECLCWDYEKDRQTALRQDSGIIEEIQMAAKVYKTGVSFGYIEKDETHLFSSQMTIDKAGKIINNFRRVSIG